MYWHWIRVAELKSVTAKRETTTRSSSSVLKNPQEAVIRYTTKRTPIPSKIRANKKHTIFCPGASTFGAGTQYTLRLFLLRLPVTTFAPTLPCKENEALSQENIATKKLKDAAENVHRSGGLARERDAIPQGALLQGAGGGPRAATLLGRHRALGHCCRWWRWHCCCCSASCSPLRARSAHTKPSSPQPCLFVDTPPTLRVLTASPGTSVLPRLKTRLVARLVQPNAERSVSRTSRLPVPKP